MESNTKGMVILYHLIYVLLLEMILNWLCIWTILMLFQNYVAMLLLNLSYNNFVETPMYENYLWTYCNMWLVVLNHVRSWFVRWLFEILRDFIGLSGLYGFKYDGLIASMIAIVLVLL